MSVEVAFEKGERETAHVPVLLPITIHHNGPANISSYFIEEDLTENQKTATFRGRRLIGTSLNFPEGVQGVVVQQKDPSHWRSVGGFEKYSYYNREVKPSSHDIPYKWNNWFLISRVLHKSISKEQVLAKVEEKKNKKQISVPEINETAVIQEIVEKKPETEKSQTDVNTSINLETDATSRKRKMEEKEDRDPSDGETEDIEDEVEDFETDNKEDRIDDEVKAATKRRTLKVKKKSTS